MFHSSGRRGQAGWAWSLAGKIYETLLSIIWIAIRLAAIYYATSIPYGPQQRAGVD